MYRRLTLIGLLVCLLLGSAVLAQGDTETLVTAGGMSVTYPEEFIAHIDDNNPYTIELAILQEGGVIAARIVGGDDIRALAGAASVETAEDVLEGYRQTQFGTFDSAAVETLELANGRGLLQPYTSPIGEGIFIAVELDDGELAFVEALSTTEDSIGDYRSALIAIAESIVFGVESASADEDAGDLPVLDLPAGVLRISEMPEGTIIFANDVMMNIPDGWEVADENETVSDSVSLTYNSFEAVSVIAISDRSTFATYNDWRDAMMIAAGSIMDDNGKPVEAEVIETESGRTIERFAGTNQLAYLVDLGGEYGAFIYTTLLLPNAATLETALADMDDVALSLTRFVRSGDGVSSSSSSSSSASSSEASSASSDAAAASVEADCYTQAREYVSASTPSMPFVCPPGCSSGGGSVWGTGFYTSDSAICVAAIHSGVLTDDGGEITIVLADGQQAYVGTTANGVTTSNWGSWGESFLVMPAD